jgi:hypothetical protein
VTLLYQSLGNTLCQDLGDTLLFWCRWVWLGWGLRELQKIGQFDCDNVDLARRMIAAMICEAALLLADAKHPAQLKRQINTVIDRVLQCFRKG